MRLLAATLLLGLLACSVATPTPQPTPEPTPVPTPPPKPSFRLVPNGAGNGPVLVMTCIGDTLAVFLEKEGAIAGDMEVLVLEGLQPLVFEHRGYEGNLMSLLNPVEDIASTFFVAESVGSGKVGVVSAAKAFVYDVRGFSDGIASLACRGGG